MTLPGHVYGDDNGTTIPRRVTLVYGKENEKPTTMKARVAIVAVWWVIGIALLVGLWFWLGWWVLVLAAVGAWATIDYLRRGQQLDQVDRFKYGM
jgi:Flp pilus assembly protein TadB